jgi:hypothetical protein
MTDDHTQGRKPDKESGRVKMSIDDMGIPILEDVVGQNRPTNPVASEPKTPNMNFSLPNNEILVTALRNQLRSQINDDIDEIAAEVSGKIVSRIAQELEPNIKAELIEILQRNLDDLINHAISKDPKREE